MLATDINTLQRKRARSLAITSIVAIALTLGLAVLVVMIILYLFDATGAKPTPLPEPVPSSWKVMCYPATRGFQTQKLRVQLQLPSSAKSIDHFEYMGRGRFGCAADMHTVIINTGTP